MPQFTRLTDLQFQVYRDKSLGQKYSCLWETYYLGKGLEPELVPDRPHHLVDIEPEPSPIATGATFLVLMTRVASPPNPPPAFLWFVPFEGNSLLDLVVT